MAGKGVTMLPVSKYFQLFQRTRIAAFAVTMIA